MQDVLHEIKERLDDNRSRLIDSEADTRALLVEPVLHALGWKIEDTRHVQREYTIGRSSRRPDYALFVDELPHVLIEVKKPGYIEDAEEQIEDYCKGTPYTGAATDGEYWTIFMDELEPRIRIDKRGAGEKLARRLSRAAVVKYSSDLLEENSGELIHKFGKQVGEDLKAHAYGVNRAVTAFSHYVVENKGRFYDPERFREMVRAYLNILNHTSGEKDTLRDVLASLPRLDSNTIDLIVKDSKPGRYRALPRTLRSKYKKKDRKVFLEMIETALSKDSTPDDIYRAFDEFDQDERSFGPATLTGIVSALCPEEFMVYNRRTAVMLSEIAHYHDLIYVDMDRYKQFNNLYKRINRLTKNELIDLDVIASLAYENDS